MPEDVDTQAPLQRMDTPKFLTQTRFDHFDLPEELLKGLTEAGFVHCSPIQAQTLPVSTAGRDVAGQAQTGTGKTAAFLVTAISRLLSMPDRKPGIPSALMVAPTRELALQIYEEALLIGKYTGLTAAQIVGGVDYGKQADILRRGVDMVICTPGRILDYMKQGIFKPDGIRILVIDTKPTGCWTWALKRICAFYCESSPLTKSASPCSFPPPCPTGSWNSPTST